MSGETDLKSLLKTLKPDLLKEEFVFCTVPCSFQVNNIVIFSSFREKEGLSLILNKEEADKLKLDYSGLFKCITITVHSSLEAVGLTAVISTLLTEHNISANVVAAFYHDHIFIQKDRAEEACKLIGNLSKNES